MATMEIERKNSHTNEKDKRARVNGLKSLTRQSFDMLLERYQDDYELFNLPLPNFNQTMQEIEQQL